MDYQVIPAILTPEEVSRLLLEKMNVHHDDEGHGDGGHHVNQLKKPNLLPWVADRFARYLWRVVDPNMKMYLLTPGNGKVFEHVDADYVDGFGTATHSLLIHLNDDYVGGETMFGANVAPTVPVGGGLLFRHSLLHSGKDVISGKKVVIKTDVY